MAVDSWNEISRRSVTINKYEEGFPIWRDCYLTVHVDKSVRIFEFSHNLRSTDKKIDCIEYSIKAPKSSPASGLLNIFKRNITGIDLAKMTMDPALWPYSNNILHEMSDITAFEWSPEFLLWNNDYLLAVLNNIGHVEFYRKEKKFWVVALNLSALIIELYKEVLDEPTSDINIITKSVRLLETSALCWAPNINDDSSAYILTAQKSGTILIWSIKEEELTVKAEYVDKISTQFSEITKVVWLRMGPKVNILCCNNEGQLFILEYHVNNYKKITFYESQVLWAHKDRMVIQHCSYVILENKIILIYSKHRCLIIQLLSNDYKVLAQITKHLNDYKISSICKHKNLFYVTTVNGSMYHIKYIVIEDTLDVQYELVNLKDFSTSCELLGGSLSENGVFLTVAAIDRKIMNRKQNLKFEIIYYAVPDIDFDIDFPEFLLLLNNPSKRLTKLTDCIEKLRYKIVKCRKIPKYNYSKLLLEGEADIYKMKVYLVILIICNVLEENFKIAQGSLPESSTENIREKIAIAHSKAMLTNIYEKYKTHHLPLTEFEIECFVGCKKYLQITRMNSIISNEILCQINKECHYTCQSCDKVLTGFSCEDGHMNSFCSVTFTPIESDNYLICKGCGVTARSELLNVRPMCIYCDLYFEYS